MGTNVIHNRLLGQKISWHLAPGQGKGLERLGRSPLFGLEPRSRGSAWAHRNGEPTLRRERDARREYKKGAKGKSRRPWGEEKRGSFQQRYKCFFIVKNNYKFKECKDRKINSYKCCM